ncbi:MAG: hypothetical protein RL684_1980 [Pseudomonadota bacterium]|jgi:hypothetical protein
MSRAPSLTDDEVRELLQDIRLYGRRYGFNAWAAEKYGCNQQVIARYKARNFPKTQLHLEALAES